MTASGVLGCVLGVSIVALVVMVWKLGEKLKQREVQTPVDSLRFEAYCVCGHHRYTHILDAHFDRDKGTTITNEPCAHIGCGCKHFTHRPPLVKLSPSEERRIKGEILDKIKVRGFNAPLFGDNGGRR